MKGRKLMVGAALLLIGVAVGGGGGYLLGKSKAVPAVPTSRQTTATKTTEEKNLYNGDELTLAEMYDSVRSVSGDDFDWRLLVYLLTIHNIESGMLRQAETKAKHQQLKDLAKIQIEQNEKVIPLLNEW